MSTIGSLMLALGQSAPKASGDILEQTQRTRGGELQNETALLKLAELKRSQASEEMVMAAIQKDPDLARLFFGDSAMGQLGQAPGGPPAAAPPSAGPLTQQTTMPGQPPGAPQVVPGGQDLSRYAGVSPQGGGPIPPDVMAQTMPQVTPPQGQPGMPVLSTLGGQPQGPMQTPQNPALEMARTNPRAAFLMQQQMQAQQDRQIKNVTTQLTIREKTAEAFASTLQGVNSQESYESAVQDLMQWAPQQASRLPKVWSKEAMQPIIDAALSAKDKATLGIAELKERIDFRKQQFTEQQAAAAVPEYTKDSTLNVAIDRLMQQAGIPRGTPPPEAILTQAQRDVEEGKVRVSASQGTGQVFDTDEGKKRLRPGTNIVEPLYTEGGQPLRPKSTQAEQTTATFANLARKGHESAVALEDKGFKPGFWAKTADKLPLDMGNYLTSEDYQKYKDHVTDFAQAWLRETSKGAITEDEWNLVNRRYFPQPGNTKDQIETKRRAREQVIKELEDVGKQTGRTGTQGQPTSQAPAGGPSGPATFDRADFLKWRQGAGKSGNPTQADVEAYFQAKGLKRR